MHKFSKEEVHFISDTHYSHKNMVRGVSNWDGGYRDFDSVEQMNDVLVANINKVVPKDGVIFHNGDWSFGGYQNIRAFRDRINCDKIYLILGNHDNHIYEDKKKELRDLFYRVDHYREISVDGQMIVMSHYPMRSWHDIQRQSWMLYGHVHGSLPDDKTSLSIDVGMDTEWFKDDDQMIMTTNYSKNYVMVNHKRFEFIIPAVDTIHSRFHPYTFDELSTIMNWKKKHRQAVDHHG